MDSSPPRVAYSFDAGTFDLRKSCPGLWLMGESSQSTMVRLDTRWELMLGGLRELGAVLASVRSGPLNLATVWPRVDFQRIPGTYELVELHSGTELRSGMLGSAMAVVDEIDGQQMASLQFSTRDGTGCLKIMITEDSDLDAFEQLVRTHAVATAWGTPTPVESSDPTEAPLPDWKQVKPLWEGLARTRPGRYFPGLAMVPRLSGLKAAAGSFAWQLQPQVDRLLLEQMTARRGWMEFAVRNRAVFMPANCTLSRASFCGCGLTFFSPQTQLTMRCGDGGAWSTWVVCLPTPEGERWNIEAYDERGELCISIGLSDTASDAEETFWRSQLLEGRLA
ncbi:hypothetical protein FEM03_01745 [Phragmitibacter flavus]|uniref:Haemin-degrading HemS/ChuX domain-containing protein n=1 Tax=Phragmitibacter flavus TaxID=2576071 RepID=A0A5R8KKP1_9BACT|nr:hypothetical protein [Phragmitibacter flavus]TLD72820.1 hypothetical protein FEM03_01745 [Phragmitibacter flavus]